MKKSDRDEDRKDYGGGMKYEDRHNCAKRLFLSGDTNLNPQILFFSSSSSLLLHFIIDFCEEDLRVGTAPQHLGETHTDFQVDRP